MLEDLLKQFKEKNEQNKFTKIQKLKDMQTRIDVEQETLKRSKINDIRREVFELEQL